MRRRRLAYSLAAGLVAVLASCGTLSPMWDTALARAAEDSAQARFKVETVARGLVHPWGLAFLPNGDLLVTERAGRLRVVRDGQLRGVPVAGVPEVYARGQGGLLDVALHPDFERTRLIYLSFAARGRGGAGTEVAQARLAPDARRLTGLEIIFRAEPKTPGSAHYGSRLAFGSDGKLYITLGDRYSYMDEAQNLGSHLGSIVRLNPNGSVPADNPFVNTPGAKPEIFSYGHRNVQGLARHPETGAVWSHEHGPRGGDEVNILEAGANYGWPEITYGIDYDGSIISDKTHAPGMKQPLVYWDPSIAPSGMAFYTGNAFPEWRGDLFIGALAHRHLRRLELDGDTVTGQEQLLSDLGARIRAVTTGPAGALYVLTDASDGRVLRLAPVAGGSG
jgi:glucose/arabinose dehydrogenase